MNIPGKYLLILLLLTLGGGLLLMVFSGTTQAKTITVDDDGNGDYEKIQWAIDNATEGDTVRVWAGIYKENVIVNKTLSLIGNGSGETSIMGDKSGSVIEMVEKGISISGFNISGSGNSTSPKHAGIMISSTSCHILENVCFNNTFGIVVHNFRDNRIERNICFESSASGIDLYNSENNTIKNNICYDNDRHGIYLEKSPEGELSNNTCFRNNETGISCRYSDETMILNNSGIENDIGIIVPGRIIVELKTIVALPTTRKVSSLKLLKTTCSTSITVL